MANLLDPEFDEESSRSGFSWKRARLGRQAGGERLGASLFELPPGQASFPYHAHFANEEMLIVVAGRPSLRGDEGWRELSPGEVVSFRVGRGGAHQIANRSGEPVRVLLISEMNAPELSFYPDSNKILAGTRPPGGEEGDDDIFEAFDLADAADYWQGESPPERQDETPPEP
jgi:uncharacterized cupin superfamily protein